MRALREQPRLTVAKLAIAIAALIATAMVTWAIAGDTRDAPPDVRPQLDRSEQQRRDQAAELQDLDARVAELRADLRTATRRARARARTSERLRRELRVARRRLARQRQP